MAVFFFFVLFFYPYATWNEATGVAWTVSYSDVVRLKLRNLNVWDLFGSSADLLELQMFIGTISSLVQLPQLPQLLNNLQKKNNNKELNTPSRTQTQACKGKNKQNAKLQDYSVLKKKKKKRTWKHFTALRLNAVFPWWRKEAL